MADSSISAPSSRAFTALGGSLVAAAAVMAYWNSLHVPFVFDDGAAILSNPSIRHFASALHPPAGGSTVDGRPLLNLSFALNYGIGGTNPMGYHAINVLIHLLAGLVLFGILRRTFTPFLGDRSQIAAFSAALLWTVHPLQTESVTYISQRAESLGSLFYLLTLFCLIRGACASGKAAAAWYAASILACLIGVGTKETIVSAPLIALFYDRTFVAGSIRQALRTRKWLYVGLFATWIPLACLVAGEHSRGGTVGFAIGERWIDYALTQPAALLRYLRLVVWPHPQFLDYGMQWVKNPWAVAPDALVVTALAAATLAGICSHRPSLRALGFAGLWLFAILAPTSLIPGARQTMAEHRMYLPSAAVIAVVIAGLFTSGARRVGLAVCAATAACLAFLTVGRNSEYRDDLRLWEDAAAAFPDNYIAQDNYGTALLHSGRTAEAMRYFERALSINPEYAVTHYDIACVLMWIPQYREAAIAENLKAVTLNPNYTDAENNLGVLLANTPGRREEAIAHYRRALQIDPDNASVHNNLGRAFLDAGNFPAATHELREALRLQPDYPEAQQNLASVPASP